MKKSRFRPDRLRITLKTEVTQSIFRSVSEKAGLPLRKRKNASTTSRSRLLAVSLRVSWLEPKATRSCAVSKNRRRTGICSIFPLVATSQALVHDRVVVGIADVVKKSCR